MLATRRLPVVGGGVPVALLGGLTLRVSVTDRCQYRCGYCLPGSVRPFLPAPRLLGVAEHGRVARAFAGQRVRKVRFTGGEPLLRGDLADLVEAWARALPQAELALTTNGLLLGRQAVRLAQAGLSRATLHVDSLRPERYVALMGQGELSRVLEGAEAARAFLDLKVNVVVQRGENDDEIPDFLRWSEATRLEVRFIEQMNTGSARGYTARTFLSGREVVERAAAAFEVEALPRRHAADPAALYRTSRGVVFGVIASDTAPFCGACDRMRLSADGRLRGCLYEHGGLDLAAALRGGADDAALRALVVSGPAAKRSMHPSVGHGASFSMSETGG